MNAAMETALQKAKHYCTYQERCHSEVRGKLYALQFHTNEVEQVLTQLIEDGFINEERFAIAFAGGKYKMKRWGKEKIKYALKQKQVSDYCVRKALDSIDLNDYKKTFNSVAAKKSQALKHEKNIFVKKKKIKDFLLQKGFEAKLIFAYLKEF